MEQNSLLTLDNLENRKSGETIVDFVIRLCSDFPICQEVSEADMPRRVSQYIIATERDPTLVRELKRELLGHSGELSEIDLFDMAVRVDRLLNHCNSGIGIHSVAASPELTSLLENQKHLQSAINRLCAVKDSGKCANCNKSHNS